EPERRAGRQEEQDSKRREHHEFALCEVDDTRRLPEQRESERSKGIDRARRAAGDDELHKIGHRRALGIGAGPWRTRRKSAARWSGIRRTELLGGSGRQGLRHGLLAVLDLDKKALAIE